MKYLKRWGPVLVLFILGVLATMYYWWQDVKADKAEEAERLRLLDEREAAFNRFQEEEDAKETRTKEPMRDGQEAP